MTSIVSSPNGQSASTGPVAGMIARIQAGANGDAEMFELFAFLAHTARRDDLRDEFRRRSTGEAVGRTETGASNPPPDAIRHHREGCRLVHDNKLAEAEIEFREAIRIHPTWADAHGDLGVASARLNRLEAAEASFTLAIRFSPSRSVLYLNLATCLLQQGRAAEVEGWARQAALLDPKSAEAHRLLGCSLDARGKADAAEVAFRDAIEIDPKLADAHYRLGVIFSRRNNPRAAETAFREATRFKPSLTSAWAALGNLLESENRAAEAIQCCQEAVRLDAASADLHNNLGVALAACDRPADAEVEYREAIRIDPRLVSAHSNLGNTLRSLDRVDEAERSLCEALRLKPDYPEGHNNLGIVLVQQGRHDDALKHYDEAIRLRDDYPEAHLNRSLWLLGAGDFVRGWSEYEWRWKIRHMKPPPGTAPRWDGKPLEGRTLLITSEQGLGDTVHFIRYAPLVKERGGVVFADCQEALAGLLATCPGVDRVVPRGTPVPPHDLTVPLLSLPGLFGVVPGIATAPIPYLRADPERIEYWRQELQSAPGLKVGIAWQGSKVHRGDRLRSVPLTRFAPLAALPGVTLYSLQKGAGTEQLGDGTASRMGIVDLGARTESDMSDTAAAIMNLDLIVTVDTAIAHVAGASHSDRKPARLFTRCLPGFLPSLEKFRIKAPQR